MTDTKTEIRGRPTEIKGCPAYPPLKCDRRGFVYGVSGKMLKKQSNGGYAYVFFKSADTGKVRGVSVARVIASTFLEKPPLTRNWSSCPFCVIHKNGRNDDDRAENLEWGTRSEARALGWSQRERRHYKERTGSVFYGSYTKRHLEEEVYIKEFHSYRECEAAGYNPARVYYAAKYGKRYKKLLWKRVDKPY